MEMEQLKETCFRNSPRSELENLGLRSVLGGFALAIFLLAPFTASAGTLRKPPNNLGLVAYWPFNEGDGTVVGDASGNGHTGTFTTTTSPVWTSGKLGSGLVASNLTTGGTTNKVALSNITTGTTYTISAWIYLTSDCVNYGAIMSQDGNEGLYCYQNGGTSNKLDFWYSGVPPDHFSSTPLALNRWYHVAIVNNAGSATFYLNGVADGTVSSVPTFNANSIGNDSLSEYLPGKLDEVRLYNRALSASDVYALYKSGAVQINNSYRSPGTLRTGLTSYYTFDGKDMIQNVTNLQGATGKNGRLVNFTSTTTAPGKVGQALRFNGTSNYMLFTNNLTTLSFISASEGTISAWVRPRGSFVVSGTLTYEGVPVVSSEAVFNGFGISRMSIGGADRLWVANGGSTEQKIGVPYNVDEWVYITWVHTGGVLYAYKNGELVGSVTSGNTTTTGLFYIGRDWSGDADYWNGDIDELRTYNRGLSASEVKQLYNLTSGTKVNKPSVNSLTTGLVGYYTFDGGDTDWSANTTVNRGSVGGTATLTSMSTTTTPTRGKVGQGLAFVSGANSSVNLGSSSSLMPGTGSFSASIWVKRSGSSGSNGLMGGRSTVFQPWWDIRESIVQISDGTQSVEKSYTLPNDNEWHHVAMVLDRTPSPDTLTVYLDGVSQGSATATLDGHSVSGVGSIFIGRGSWVAASLFQGSLDEARIYNRTLSATEVLQLYRQGK